MRQAPRAGLSVWIRDHPGERLPRSVKGIVELTGLTSDQVKVYLSHKRKEIKDRLAKLPDLHFRKVVFEEPDGTRIRIEPKDKYKFAVDHWSLNVYIIIGLGHRCLIKDLDDFERRIK
jgi:hypothetical protein